MANTSLKDLKRLYQMQSEAFSFENTSQVNERLGNLGALAEAMRGSEAEIVTALNQDFGARSVIETRSAEIGSIISHIHYTKKNLKRWSKPVRLSNFAGTIPGKTYIRREPKGVVGIISPWNYPIQLSFIPMITAIAAGNRVMMKPSELTPQTNAVMKSITESVFDESEIAWVFGEADVGAAFSKLPFDHIFYTGSTTVGRLVAIEAAKNLTPTTLELGGKSPCIMMPDADVENHAKRVAFGKFYNAGQTCVAPDYLLVPKGRAEEYGNAIIKHVTEFYATPSEDDYYTSVINDRAFDRFTQLVQTEIDAGNTVMRARFKSQSKNSRQFLPAVILNPTNDSLLMQEEIFGPILPIVEYSNIDDAVDLINKNEHPLALYAFGKDTKKAQEILDRTTSGGAVINGAILHVAVEHLPFGGVGKSGHGAYHGERGFREFSHERSVLVMPQWKFLTEILTPPYGKTIRKMINKSIAS